MGLTVNVVLGVHLCVESVLVRVEAAVVHQSAVARDLNATACPPTVPCLGRGDEFSTMMLIIVKSSALLVSDPVLPAMTNQTSRQKEFWYTCCSIH